MSRRTTSCALGAVALLLMAVCCAPAGAESHDDAVYVRFDDMADDATAPARDGSESRLERAVEFWKEHEQGETNVFVFSEGVQWAQYKSTAGECRGDYFFPLFNSETLLHPGIRAVLYVLALIYSFIGVSIIADIFMSSIEVITSTQRTVIIDGENITVHVWNDTVANLTLMALGSSAPEILLAVVEATWQLGSEPVRGKGLGPGTIVGSAAFNLLFIIGVCITVIPDGEVRRIEQLPVFLVTAFFSVFAYVWMLITLVWWTPEEVTLAEALLTFAFFPVLVGLAFVADVKSRADNAADDNKVVPEERIVKMDYRAEGVAAAEDGGSGTQRSLRGSANNSDAKSDQARTARPSATYTVNKRDLAVMLAEERERRREANAGGRKSSSPHQQERYSNAFKAYGRATNKGGKDRVPYSRYRIQGIRDMTHGKKVLVTDEDVERIARAQFEQLQMASTAEGAGNNETITDDDEEELPRVSFSSRSYTCPESAGEIEITVIRDGNLDTTTRVKFETSAGTASPGQDYVHTHGTLTFAPGDVEQKFKVTVIDDDTWEPDELFFVHLRPAGAIARSASLVPNAVEGGVEDKGARSVNDSFRAGSEQAPHSGASASTINLNSLPGVTHVTHDNAPATQGAERRGKRPSDEPHHRATAGGGGGSASGANPGSRRGSQTPLPHTQSMKMDKVFISPYDTAVVTIIDDDKPGTFDFARAHYVVQESADKVVLTVVRTEGSDGDVMVGYHTREEPDSSFARPEGSNLSKVASDYYRQVRKGDGFVNFRGGETEAMITIPLSHPTGADLLDKGPVSFAVALFIPDRIDGSPQGAFLGENRGTTIVTITSDEQVQQLVSQVATAMQSQLAAFTVESDSWMEQFKEAVQFEYEPEEGSFAFAAVFYVITFGWKVVFSLVPPTSLYMGYPTFICSLIMIGVTTAAIGDIATMLGCVLGIPDAISAISIVALGTSLPDFFASKVAAVNDEHADASIGNVTGSNSVNVFLGLGFPWVLSAIYHAAQGTTYVVYPGTLSFSVGIFSGCALIALSVIMLRRKIAGGELGGPKRLKNFTGALFIGLWFVYIMLSVAQAVGAFPGIPPV